MTGEKKIVGLWRDSAANPDAEAQAEAAVAAPETAPAVETTVPEERDWLDMSAITHAAQDYDETDAAVSSWKDRIVPALLIMVAIGWVAFAAAAGTDRFTRAPAFAAWPVLLATIAMPLFSNRKRRPYKGLSALKTPGLAAILTNPSTASVPNQNTITGPNSAPTVAVPRH